MINNVVIMGRFVSTPELKYTSSQTEVTSFTLAVERSYTCQGEQRQTDFINCVAWRNTAEFISKYFRKGDMVAVMGSIQTRNYEDKNGNKRTVVEVLVDRASFCGSKAETGNNNQPQYNDFEEISGDDDLPFWG